MDEASPAAIRANSRPYVLTMEKAFQLALLNSRTYQFQLENLYINALPVTLQRFSFGPQFIAGLSPTTAVAGAGGPGGILPTQIPANSFLYNTRATAASSRSSTTARSPAWASCSTTGPRSWRRSPTSWCSTSSARTRCSRRSSPTCRSRRWSPSSGAEAGP